MIAVDTSVAVAAFSSWHTLHDPARTLLDSGVALPAHVLLETYSVLTGFPPPHRAAPDLVQHWLEERFSTVLDPPDPAQLSALLAKLASAGRTGGAIYDAVVAITAKSAGATLATADRRALATYELVGVAVHTVE